MSSRKLMDGERALVEKIAGSNAFRDVESLRNLLLFLFEHREKRLFARDIEILHYGFPENHHKHDPQHSRERVDQLKARLERYSLENPNDEWTCDLPDAKGKQGYRLVFHKLNKTAKAVSSFWAPHIDSGKEISVVSDPLLFFYEHQSGRVLRFVDTNIEGINRKQALLELKRLHLDFYSEDLVVGHFYIDVGAMSAAELIREYFRKSNSMHVPLVLSKEASQQSWVKASPILLGTTRTNTVMRRIFGAPETKSLGYRLHPERFAWVTINDAKPNERRVLEKLGEVIEWSDESNFTTTSPNFSIGIVTRIPNPNGGTGVMTFITSDATWNTTRMAATLTEEIQLRAIFAQIERPINRPLPESFEMMFLVRLWPGDLDDEAAEAQLLAWRPLQ